MAAQGGVKNYDNTDFGRGPRCALDPFARIGSMVGDLSISFHWARGGGGHRAKLAPAFPGFRSDPDHRSDGGLFRSAKDHEGACGTLRTFWVFALGHRLRSLIAGHEYGKRANLLVLTTSDHSGHWAGAWDYGSLEDVAFDGVARPQPGLVCRWRVLKNKPPLLRLMPPIDADCN